MNPVLQFEKEKERNVKKMARSKAMRSATREWFNQSCKFKYSYNFAWLGRPVIQYPQDLLAMQEIVWKIKPDLIIETGIAHGGSLIYYASLLELMGGKGMVLGIDVDIRKHNRKAIEAHPMFKRIRMIQSSSIEPALVERVHAIAKKYKRILVVLDSNHTHEHVAAELKAYAPLVTRGSYLVVFDTVVQFMPKGSFPNRPWGHNNNPWTAVREFLKQNGNFKLDKYVQDKAQITVAPDGFLKRIR
jgi:cephalosporin hydroxylase